VPPEIGSSRVRSRPPHWGQRRGQKKYQLTGTARKNGAAASNELPKWRPSQTNAHVNVANVAVIPMFRKRGDEGQGRSVNMNRLHSNRAMSGRHQKKPSSWQLEIVRGLRKKVAPTDDNPKTNKKKIADITIERER
jgi:hypothetical protein